MCTTRERQCGELLIASRFVVIGRSTQESLGPDTLVDLLAYLIRTALERPAVLPAVWSIEHSLRGAVRVCSSQKNCFMIACLSRKVGDRRLVASPLGSRSEHRKTKEHGRLSKAAFSVLRRKDEHEQCRTFVESTAQWGHGLVGRIKSNPPYELRAQVTGLSCRRQSSNSTLGERHADSVIPFDNQIDPASIGVG